MNGNQVPFNISSRWLTSGIHRLVAPSAAPRAPPEHTDDGKDVAAGANDGHLLGG